MINNNSNNNNVTYLTTRLISIDLLIILSFNQLLNRCLISGVDGHLRQPELKSASII